MLSVWTVVKPAKEDHERAGQAGVVWKVNAKKYPDQVVVKWDTDETIETVAVSDLVVL